MTGRAVIHDADMIKCRGFKTGGLVAVDAIPVGRHMVIVFSGGSSAIMTGRTVVHDALVIKPGTGKGLRVMAHRAIPGCVLVNCVIRRPGRCSTIVAGRTVIYDTGMIEHRRRKGTAGYVTDTAIFRCVLVNRVIRRPDYRSSVMTGLTTSTRNIRAVVVDKRGGKVNRVVADNAIRGGVLMNCRRRRFSGVKPDIIAIMARDTIAGDAHMVENRGCEHISRVAKVTILVCRQMVSCLNQIRS